MQKADMCNKGSYHSQIQTCQAPPQRACFTPRRTDVQLLVNCHATCRDMSPLNFGMSLVPQLVFPCQLRQGYRESWRGLYSNPQRRSPLAKKPPGLSGPPCPVKGCTVDNPSSARRHCLLASAASASLVWVCHVPGGAVASSEEPKSVIRFILRP